MADSREPQIPSDAMYRLWTDPLHAIKVCGLAEDYPGRGKQTLGLRLFAIGNNRFCSRFANLRQRSQLPPGSYIGINPHQRSRRRSITTNRNPRGNARTNGEQ